MEMSQKNANQNRQALCHIIIHTMSHHHTYYVTSSYILCAQTKTDKREKPKYDLRYVTSSYILCHIIIHTMSHHHTDKREKPKYDLRYVTSSYILCHIIIHT